MRINHNSMALNASDHFAKLNKSIAKSMEKLSSGYKITSPADDAAGLAISTKMNAQIKGLSRAALNSNDGISVVQSAESGLSEMHNILKRMRELAVQAANDVNNEEDRDAIQNEIDSLAEELDQISDTTAFNGQKLLNGSAGRRTMSSNDNVGATYYSNAVPAGKYVLSSIVKGESAIYRTGLRNDSSVVTESQAGTLTVNGFDVTISEGMTKTEIFEELQGHLHKIGVDVLASYDGGKTEAKFTSNAPVYFKTQEPGSDEKIKIKCDNPELAALLGVSDGDLEIGKDCRAELEQTEDGFTNTATLTTLGNTITVVDRNGFEMNIEVDPENTGRDAEIQILSAGSIIIQTGANSGEQVSLDIPNMDARSLGVDSLSMYTHELASKAVAELDKAIVKVSGVRSVLGATENRFGDIYDNLQVQNESITAAYSRIMDTDMAEEMTNYTQLNVLGQAAIAMIQKSNERPESLLQLLQ